MGEDEIKTNTLARLFENGKKTELKLENIDTKMDSMIEFKNLIHEVIFGNGKPGIKGKVDIISSQVVKLWGFIVLLMTAIITASIVVIFVK